MNTVTTVQKEDKISEMTIFKDDSEATLQYLVANPNVLRGARKPKICHTVCIAASHVEWRGTAGQHFVC